MLKLELPQSNGTRKKTVSKKDQSSVQTFISSGIKVNEKQKESFFSELALLSEASLDIKSSLEALLDGQGNNNYRKIVANVKFQVTEGESLSNAMKKAGCFTAYDITSVKIGEESGQLTQILKGLAAHYSKKIENKKMLVQLLTYPVIVLTTAFIVVSFMLQFVVPMFADVFKRFNTELPQLTKIVLAVSHHFKTFFIWFLLFITTIILFNFYNRNKDWWKDLTSKLLLKIPYFGAIVYSNKLLQLINTMGVMLKAHVPLAKCIQMAEEITDFYPLKVSLNEIYKEIVKGKTLHQALSKHSIYPQRFNSLVKMAEDVNKLEAVFDYYAKQLHSDIEHKNKLLGSMLEPFLLIFLGLVVAVILVALYLPIFQLGSSVY